MTEPTPSEFLSSMRGQYIIAQALHYGIEALQQVPKPYQESSNLSDMEYLRDNLFTFPVADNNHAIEQAKKEGLMNG